MISEYEDEIEQIRIQLNSENNFDLVQLFSHLSTNNSVNTTNLCDFYIKYSDEQEINTEELELYLTKIIFFYDEDRNGKLSYSEFISFVLSQTKYNLRRKIHINHNDDNKNELSNNIIILFNGLVEKEIELIQNLENFENQLYQIENFNPSLIFDRIKNNGFITPGSIIMILDEQDIKISNSSIQNIMRRFDINGDCRIELEDFVIIMNLAQIKQLNYGKDILIRNKEFIYDNNKKINLSSDYKIQKNKKENFMKVNINNNNKLKERRIEHKLNKKITDDNNNSYENNFYNKKNNSYSNENSINNINNLSNLSNSNNINNNLNQSIRNRTPIRKNIINDYVNDNDFRKSKRNNQSCEIIERINNNLKIDSNDDCSEDLNLTPNNKTQRFLNNNSNYKSFVKEEIEKIKKNSVFNDIKNANNKINNSTLEDIKNNLNNFYHSNTPNSSNNLSTNIFYDNNSILLTNINNITSETYRKVKKEYFENDFKNLKSDTEISNEEKLNIILNKRKQKRKINKSIIITGYIKLEISMEIEIEQTKIILSKKEDFNIKTLFNIFESKTYPEKISISSFKRASINFNIELSNKDLYLIFKKYDIEQKGYLIYEDFFNIFVPYEKEYRDDILKKENLTESITNETSIIIEQILRNNIEFENQLDRMRKEMNVHKQNIKEYFDLIDKEKKGYIIYDDLHIFMNNYLENNVSNQIGINLFFLKLDKKKLNKLYFEDLYREIKF